MKDKKLTDKEIVKALECCAGFDPKLNECSKCPYDGECGTTESNMPKDALDLINRLQADSKRLKKVQMQLDDAMKMYHVIKAEAYKECIEKAKEQCNKIPQYHFNLLNVEWYLDNLLKELVGEDK